MPVNNSFSASLVQGIQFLGDYDDFSAINFEPRVGDVIMKGDSLWVCNGVDWMLLECNEIVHNEPQQSRNVKKLRNCRNCGAPSGHKDYCEYCGSFLLEEIF